MTNWQWVVEATGLHRGEELIWRYLRQSYTPEQVMNILPLNIIVCHPPLDGMKHLQLLDHKRISRDEMLEAGLGEIQNGVSSQDGLGIAVDKVGTVVMQSASTVQVGMEIELKNIGEVCDGTETIF